MTFFSSGKLGDYSLNHCLRIIARGLSVVMSKNKL